MVSKRKMNVSCYRVEPSVLKADQMQTVTIYPIGEYAKFDDHKAYTVQITPMEHTVSQKHYISSPQEEVAYTTTVMPKNGAISVSYCFLREQQWVISVCGDSLDANPNLKFHVYSLEEDLYQRRPLKGDLHAHSICSDGREGPDVVAANYRKGGFDFLAITDHSLWDPSDAAIDTYKNVPIDFKLFHGEEVHIHWYLHIVNFGGAFGVEALFRSNEETYRKEIGAYAKTCKLPDGIDALEYAYRKWTVDKIHQGGGLAILAHPFWNFSDAYHMRADMTQFLLETGMFDAYELVSGQEVTENNLQTAFYYEMRANGLKIPVVGSSDSHGTDPANYFKLAHTIVFAKDDSFDAIASAIKDLYSVAVECVPGEHARIHGPYRMVKYAAFLMEYYFPYHDALCVQEGRWMKEFCANPTQAEKRLGDLSGQIEAYWNRFARPEN